MSDDLTPEQYRNLLREFLNQRGVGGGGFGGARPAAPREYGVGNPQGYGGAVIEAIQQGRLAVDADGNLIPGPNFDPNNEQDNYLLGRYQAGMLTEDPDQPEQQGVSVEEFEQIFGEGFITEEMVEDGMYTDPETGIVYVINFPPDYQISEDAGGGGGGGEPEPEPSGGVQIGEDDQWVYQGNGIFRRDSDGAVIDVTDPDSSFYDDDFDPNNNPFIVGSIYGGPGRIGEPEPQPEPVEACPPGTVYNDLLGICEVDLTVPTKGDAPRQAPVEPEPVDPDDGDGDGDGNGDGAGDGDGNGAGDGDGDGNGDGDGTGTGAGAGGMLSPDGAFKPFMTSIGYTPVQLQQLIAPPKKDYFRELDGLIGRSLFGKMLK